MSLKQLGITALTSNDTSPRCTKQRKHRALSILRISVRLLVGYFVNMQIKLEKLVKN